MSIPTVYHEWPGFPGGNWAYWLRDAELIGKFIQANALKPAAIGQVTAGVAPTAKTLIDLNIRGGIRGPHLHFDNRIYMLNSAQWAKFSGAIIADCKAKLASVKKVSFEEGMLLGSAVQSLASE